jgi:hypothetical protein
MWVMAAGTRCGNCRTGVEFDRQGHALQMQQRASSLRPADVATGDLVYLCSISLQHVVYQACVAIQEVAATTCIGSRQHACSSAVPLL